MSHLSRVVILIDMDCFYCQVEEKLNPSLKGKPVAVVQYNEWRGGGIIAVNYPARDRGVTRHMRGYDAKEKCPDIQLVKVPQVRGKADLTKYRDAGASVADVLLTFTPHLERASVDEAYLDITDLVEKKLGSDYSITHDKLKNTYVVGTTTQDFIESVNNHENLNDSDLKLAIGGMIAEEIREEIYNVTEYRCSAGVAHNKVLAKLVCGLHKPNKQTILPHSAVTHLYKDMPLKKVRGLGGKCGVVVSEKLNITTMGELEQFSRKDFSKLFDDNLGVWLYNIARGIDMEPVKERLLSKSISCCKQFQGRAALTTGDSVEHWLRELSDEMHVRLTKDLEDNNRKAKLMIVSFSNEHNHCSRSLPLHSYDTKAIFNNALKIIQKNCQKSDGSFCIKYLGVGVSSFEVFKKTNSIKTFFQNMKEKKPAPESIKDVTVSDDAGTSETDDMNYSATTETEEITDSKELIYFEELHPESIVDQSFINEISPDMSSDSIDSELRFDDDTKLTEQRPNVSSFFAKYYDVSVRDFNTSKCLESSNPDESDENSVDLVLPDTNVQICDLCGKTILECEVQTHNDYHFAMNLVKEERQLHQPTVSPKNQQTNVRSSKKPSKNAKSNATPKSKSILGYLQKKPAEIDEAVSTTCPECNKRILIESLDEHIDFHIAKKIRLEDSYDFRANTVKDNLAKKKTQNGISKFLTR